MGNQGSSNPDQKIIQKWIKDGKIGKLIVLMVGLIDQYGLKGIIYLIQIIQKNLKEWIGTYGLVQKK